MIEKDDRKKVIIINKTNKKKRNTGSERNTQTRFVPHCTDTQSLARDTPYCARSTLDIVVQVR